MPSYLEVSLQAVGITLLDGKYTHLNSKQSAGSLVVLVENMLKYFVYF